MSDGNVVMESLLLKSVPPIWWHGPTQILTCLNSSCLSKRSSMAGAIAKSTALFVDYRFLPIANFKESKLYEISRRRLHLLIV